MIRPSTRCLGIVALALVLAVALGIPGATPVRAGGPEGQMTWGVHISLAPTWFDPAETPGIITPFMILYALHDAMVKPMPGSPMAPSLAESGLGLITGRAYSAPYEDLKPETK